MRYIVCVLRYCELREVDTAVGVSTLVERNRHCDW